MAGVEGAPEMDISSMAGVKLKRKVLSLDVKMADFLRNVDLPLVDAPFENDMLLFTES